MIRTGLIWSAGAIAVMLGILYWAMGALPGSEQIPVHWGLSGPDSFSDKPGALFTLALLPGAAFFVAALMALAPMLDPFKDNLRKSHRAYLAVWASTMILLTALTAGLAFSMSQAANPDAEVSKLLVRGMIAGCGLTFMVLGNYLPKTRPSFFLGFRTPWTLTSDYTWEKTHRLGGRLLMIAGMMGIVSAFVFDGPGILIGFMVPLISAKLFTVAYSWWVWRHAADRNEGADYVV